MMMPLHCKRDDVNEMESSSAFPTLFGMCTTLQTKMGSKIARSAQTRSLSQHRIFSRITTTTAAAAAAIIIISDFCARHFFRNKLIGEGGDRLLCVNTEKQNHLSMTRFIHFWEEEVWRHISRQILSKCITTIPIQSRPIQSFEIRLSLPVVPLGSI